MFGQAKRHREKIIRLEGALGHLLQFKAPDPTRSWDEIATGGSGQEEKGWMTLDGRDHPPCRLNPTLDP